MRIKDRAIRDELRREADAVSTPDDLWEKINLGLDQEPPQLSVADRVRSHHGRGPVRRLIAVGAAAGILWMMVSPAGINLEQSKGTKVGSDSAVHGQKEEAVATDSPEAKQQKRQSVRDKGRAASDSRWPSAEIALLR